MSRVLPILIITVLAFGCTNALSIKGFNEQNTYIYSDFKIISNSNILSSEISKVFEKEINKEEIFLNFYENTWVHSIQYDIRWPNRLNIKIKEHQPLAIWKNEGYLTHSGLIITPSQTDLKMILVVLEGPENKSFELLDYSREIQSQLNRFDAKISKLKIDSEGYVTATTASNSNFIFSQEDFRDQLERLESFISFELISGRLDDIKKMDFRYKNGVSVLFS